MKKFEYKSFKNTQEATDRLNEVYAYMKELLKVDEIINYDVLPIYSTISKLYPDLNSCTFKAVYGTKIYTNGFVKLYATSFKELHKIDSSTTQLNGRNNCRVEIEEDGTFYDSNLRIIIAYDQEGYDKLRQELADEQRVSEAWIDYNDNVRPFMKKLGERFEIKEEIYMHFLEVLPPIVGKGCFYCSELIRYTPQGNPVYYKLTRKGNKFYIELNTAK